MKTRIKNPSLLAALVAGTAFMLAGQITAQTFTTLHSFSGANGDGANPNGLMQGSDGNLYGTTSSGGAYTNGSECQISTKGQLTTLYSFTGENDGASPNGTLVQGSDGKFYGTTSGYANNGGGNVFKINYNGVLTHLDLFPGTNDNFVSELVQGIDGNIYGTMGGTNGDDVAFRISANGVVTTLFSFTLVPNFDPNIVQGSDGNFYGTTPGEYHFLPGILFKISTNGSQATLYSFGSGYFNGLVQGRDGNFYGTTYSPYGGTVFKFSTNGALTSLYSFTGGSDGADPLGGLVQGSDGYFYGTTRYGGNTNLNNGFGCGTLFKISANGVLTSLHSFSFIDGAYPQAALVQGSDGNFYGTTYQGGQAAAGTVFRLVPPPQLSILPCGANVILSWSTNATGLTLQSTTNLGEPVWTTDSPPPVVVNGQNTVTNPISGTKQFFRLSQ